MKSISRVVVLTLLAAVPGGLALVASPARDGLAQQVAKPGLPNEIPSRFEPVTDRFDYSRRTVMIPMRDGVGLHR
jgi:hypothetical protein